MSVSLRASVDEVSSMAEELGLTGLLGLTSPDGKSPSKGSKGSRSPTKVTKDVIYKKFDKQWERSSHGVLKDRYESKPHKPPVLDKRDLARLADPIKGRYKSLAEYEDRMGGVGLDDSTDEYMEGGGAFLTDIGIENRSNMSMEMDRTGGSVGAGETGGIFLTENADGSVSPVKKSVMKPAGPPQQSRNVQYNRSGQPGPGGGSAFPRGRLGSGVSSRNGAVSRLKGKLEEASRLDYKRGRGGLQSTVLSSSDRLSAGISNRRGVVPGSTAQKGGSNRFGASTGNLRSVRSSGYGLQQNTSGGSRSSQQAGNNTSMRGGRGLSSVRRGSIGRSRQDDPNKSMSNENNNNNANNNPSEKPQRGRVYSRPGVPRLSRQPVGSMRRSKSRSRGGDRAGTAEDKDKKSNTGAVGGAGSRGRGASRGRTGRGGDPAATGGGRGGTSRTSRSSSRTRRAGSRDTDARGAGAGTATAASRVTRRGMGGPMSRSGSAGGGLAAVRERRAGGAVSASAGAGATGTGGEGRGVKDVSFRRLGNQESAAARKRREEALKRGSQKRGGNNNSNQDRGADEDATLPRARNSESAPTTTRRRAALDSTGKKTGGGVSNHISSGAQAQAQAQRSRTASSVSKKGPLNPAMNNPANPLSASASAPSMSMQPPKDTMEVLKALAGVQESEQKRLERAGAMEDTAAPAPAPAPAPGKVPNNPAQALSRGPGGAVQRNKGKSVASGKDGSKQGKDAAAGSGDTSMAAVLAAKASKLQAQFQKADSLRSSFQAVDEAESLAMNLESRGLGHNSFMPAKDKGDASADTTSTTTTTTTTSASASASASAGGAAAGRTPEKKASSPLERSGATSQRELQELQKSMDEGKLRSMIENDKGFDDL